MKIGRFQVSSLVRKAGYKSVWQARSKGKSYLIHEYMAPEAAEHEFLFSEHIQIPGVDRFIEKFRDQDRTVLVQAYLGGVSPKIYFSENRPLARKIAFARSVLSVLKQVHDKGVVYNNLSLETISIGSDGAPVLHDFISATMDGYAAPRMYPHAFNPYFSPPERAGSTEAPLSVASDYYSFGVLLYWLITGRLPFDADDISQLISLHLAGQPDSPDLLAPEIPKTLSQIVLRLLEKEASARYQSAEGILFDLDHYPRPGFRPATRDMGRSFMVSPRIYGREHEIRLLEKATACLHDETCGLITLAGYSGVGKSSIVWEFQKQGVPRGSRLVSGKFEQYKKDIPYFAIVEALDALFDMLLLSEQGALDDFSQSFADSIGDQGLILTSVFPKLELIVGQQPEVDSLVGEEAENRFNYLFLKLIRLLATRERPLIIFLDDLQWTDLGSLNVLRAVLDSGPSCLLVILAYRSNEVNLQHPFRQFLDDVARYDLVHRQMEVRDLTRHDLSCLIGDSLGCEDPDLTRIVFEKTRGNAFFIHQLLKELSDRGYFKRDVTHKKWTIDPEKVSALNVAGNVVDFMQTRLERLPQATCDLLKIIGAVGHRVGLDVLSKVAGLSEDAILNTLRPGFNEGLLVFETDHVCFIHDKIQQACYQLNRDSDLPGLHFNIAKTLMRHGLSDRPEDLFHLAGHLDKGFDLIDKNDETYIDIYLKTALHGKKISAYGEFLVYVRQAMNILTDTVSSSIRFKVYREYHIALYLNSQFEAADAFFDDHLADHEDFLALKENYFAKVSQDSMGRRYEDAVVFGLSILKKMGIELSSHPRIEDLAGELEQLEVLLERAGINKISDLGRIEQKNIQEMRFICEIIQAMVPAAFFFNPAVACQLIFTTVKLAVQNGVFEAMAYPLSMVSTPFILIRNDYLSGFEYAQFAINIAKDSKRSLGNAKHIFLLTCWHWARPIQDNTAIEMARDAHHLLMQGGDIQMAGYTYCTPFTYFLDRGDTLETVRAELERSMDFNRKTHNLHGLAGNTTTYQLVRTLMSEQGDFINFGMDGFDETAFIRDNEKNAMALCLLYISKTQAAYMCGAHRQAHQFGLKTRDLIAFIPGFFSVQSGVYYRALSACAVLDPADSRFSMVLEDLEQLRQWRNGAPENFTQKVYFLEAEIARRKKDVLQAIQCYIKAIAAARKNRFIQEKALIFEQLASFWKEQKNTELCEHSAKEAYSAYELWGAKIKCRQLRQKYPAIYFESQTQNIDLLNVIKSQNILARETNIKTLLTQMMQILLEISGAQRAFLILKDNAWSIEAFKRVQGEEIILKTLPLEEDLLSVDMVNYVIRTGQMADLNQFPGYLEDAYINRVRPQSLIVLPARVGSRLIAVIYLEHRRMKNIFTPKKQEMVQLLSTQAAISLDNARVYRQMEQRIEERTQALAAQNRELAVARKKAEAANAAKSKFLASMSHELRTPLNAVTGFSELLGSMVSDPKQQSYLTAIKSAGRNLLALINDVLDLSRLEAEKMDVTYEPASIGAIVEDIRQMFEAEIHTRDLSLKVSMPPDQPEWLYLDETRIRQVLLNLVGNAVKFTRAGVVTVSSVYEKTGDGQGRLKICVADTGIGIPEQAWEKIFKSFEQQPGQDAAKYGGAGLGLAITKGLVGLMGGTISVVSTPGQGSCFTVDLPDVRTASPRIRLPGTGAFDLALIQFEPARVLVVDDKASNRLLLKEILTRAGLSVVTAGNGIEAVKTAQTLMPELILMDIDMPLMSGLDAAGTLKNSDATSHIPVIGLAVSSTEPDGPAICPKGFDAFLSKPFTVERVVTELTRHLKFRQGKTVPPKIQAGQLELSPDTVLEPERLAQRLNEDVLPCFNTLQERFIAGEFKTLGETLMAIGDEFNAEQVSGAGTCMVEMFNRFDISEMDKCLDRYSKDIAAFVLKCKEEVRWQQNL